MYILVLGLDVLGNPFGLIRGLSEGVEALFYEPFQVRHGQSIAEPRLTAEDPGVRGGAFPPQQILPKCSFKRGLKTRINHGGGGYL